MIAERPQFEAQYQDTVVVIHDFGDFHFAIITNRLRVPEGPGVTEITEKVRVVPEDGVYTLRISVPEAELKGQWLVTVLLPPGTAYAGTEDGIETPSRLDNGRNILSWTDDQDPVLDVIWSLVGR